MQSKFMFLFNKHPVPYCRSYEYLGCYIDEHLSYEYTVGVLADSAGKALSSVISKMIKNHGFPYSVYTQLYDSCVCSVSLYGSEVFGYNEYDSLHKLHLRAIRAFFGLPKNVTSLLA